MAHTCKSKATARRGLTRSTDARRGHTRLLGFRWGALLALLGSPHAQPHRHTHSHITSAQGKGARRTADGTADGERTREHLEAKKMPKKMKPNRVYMPAECGGVTTPPLLSNALRLQTARGKSALVASVAPGRCGRDRVRFMRDRAGSERKGAGSRAQVGRGMAGWDGLDSAPQNLDLRMPNEFQ